MRSLSNQGAAVKIEPFIYERSTEQRRRSVNELPTKITLPVFKGNTGYQLADALEELRSHT